jgi:hypothetical protein
VAFLRARGCSFRRVDTPETAPFTLAQIFLEVATGLTFQSSRPPAHIPLRTGFRMCRRLDVSEQEYRCAFTSQTISWHKTIRIRSRQPSGSHSLTRATGPYIQPRLECPVRVGAKTREYFQFTQGRKAIFTLSRTLRTFSRSLIRPVQFLPLQKNCISRSIIVHSSDRLTIRCSQPLTRVRPHFFMINTHSFQASLAVISGG